MNNINIEETLSKKKVYTGKIVDVEIQEVRTHSGRKALREIVRHSGAIVVIATLPDGRLVLVKQYRKAIEKALIEFVAGCIEPGEEAKDCALRELKEETGYSAKEIVYLGTIYPSPGCFDEKIEVFSAELNAEAGDVSPDEDEKLEVLLLTKDEFLDMIRVREIEDAKTLAAWALNEILI